MECWGGVGVAIKLLGTRCDGPVIHTIKTTTTTTTTTFQSPILIFSVVLRNELT